MSEDDFKKATSNLKKTVPLMMKHRIAATPANYALWYTYVDNAIPELNSELDYILNSFGFCPAATGDQLYKDYIASNTETNVHQLKENVEVLVHELSSSMDDALSDTNAFTEVIDKSFSNLEKVQNENLSLDEAMNVMRNLIGEAQGIRHSTAFLNDQLNNASQEIARLKTQLAQVHKAALFDSLSGLYNRRAFDDDLAALMQSEQALSLIFLDIDHFKVFNDEYGHLFGDTVIRAIAKRLQSTCQAGITAYRYGGEEFALLVPHKSLRVARQFAEMLRTSIERLNVKDRRTSKQVSSITASFGVAEKTANDTPETIVERADRKLYEAKKLGRNRVMPF